MTLHAARDRLARGDRDLGGKHALDLYRLVAMLTRQEEGEVVSLLRRHPEHPPVAQAAQIVGDLFAGASSPGVLAALRQHGAGGEGAHRMLAEPFLETLTRLFVDFGQLPRPPLRRHGQMT